MNGSVVLNFQYSGDRMKGSHYTEIRLSEIRWDGDSSLT